MHHLWVMAGNLMDSGCFKPCRILMVVFERSVFSRAPTVLVHTVYSGSLKVHEGEYLGVCPNKCEY